ncbi:esterase/lipase family protein [Streptomyces lavendulae]|uniref:esterase/lipase family protein n=1 Tax=Streptomyces lavendulae TaxID=1914 RepID=UPI0036BA28A7
MTGPQREIDIATRFLAGDTSERMDLLRDEGATLELQRLLGPTAFSDLSALAATTGGWHLADDGPTNLVFVPGVMGSALASEGIGGIWWIDYRSRNRIDDLGLSADGLADTHAAFRITPVAVDSSYEGFLVAAVRQDGIHHIPFPYDWRKPLLMSADRLYERMLAERDQGPGQNPIHLVAHSMGGLVVRTALMRHPEMWRHVGKIVFVGTPHYGAPAIGGYLKNHLWGFDVLFLIGRYLSRNTFRSLWGVLGLLPAPVDVYPETSTSGGAVPDAAEYPHPCANFDLYSAPAWRLGLSPEEEARLQAALDAAARHHRDLHSWHESLDQNLRDRMAVIAGTGYRTLFRLAYVKRFGFRWEHMDRVTERIAGNPHREGDGRVPIASARLKWTGETRYVKGEHTRLPNLTSVQEDVWRFLADRPMQLPTTPAAALRGHLGEDPVATGAWGPLGRTPDDPGYLDLAVPTRDVLADLEAALDAGRLPEFIHARLL